MDKAARTPVGELRLNMYKSASDSNNITSRSDYKYPKSAVSGMEQKSAPLKDNFKKCSKLYKLYSEITKTNYEILQGDHISRLVEEKRRTKPLLFRETTIPCAFAHIWILYNIYKMLYYKKLDINGRTCVAVHAGYTEEPENIGEDFAGIEEFYLFAREEGYLLGGTPHGMVIAGHTPTIAENIFAYNNGNVFRYYDTQSDCVFYDIDCGCVFRDINSDAKLACIRLEDEKVFYL